MTLRISTTVATLAYKRCVPASATIPHDLPDGMYEADGLGNSQDSHIIKRVDAPSAPAGVARRGRCPEAKECADWFGPSMKTSRSLLKETLPLWDA